MEVLTNFILFFQAQSASASTSASASAPVPGQVPDPDNAERSRNEVIKAMAIMQEELLSMSSEAIEKISSTMLKNVEHLKNL